MKIWVLRHRILFVLFGVATVLAAAELFLRLQPGLEDRYSTARFRSDQLWLKDFSYLRPSALLGYECIPNSQPRINSYGMVSKEYKFIKDKDVFRILILGDSIAEQGWIGEYLEERLNDNKPNSRYKFEIWNAGVGSYDVRRYALYLKHKGLRYNPDMVVIFFCMNDFELNLKVYYKNNAGVTNYQFPVSEISKKYTASPFLLKHSFLYRFIVLRLNSYMLSRKKTQNINRDEEAGRYYLQMIKDICEARKIPLFAVIFPYLKPLGEYEPYQKEEYDTICNVVKEKKISILNLNDRFSGVELAGFRGERTDESHPSREAGYIISGVIYDYLFNSLAAAKN
jgi:lysophospholipase L1-like esterase